MSEHAVVSIPVWADVRSDEWEIVPVECPVQHWAPLMFSGFSAVLFWDGFILHLTDKKKEV